MNAHNVRVIYTLHKYTTNNLTQKHRRHIRETQNNPNLSTNNPRKNHNANITSIVIIVILKITFHKKKKSFDETTTSSAFPKMNQVIVMNLIYGIKLQI